MVLRFPKLCLTAAVCAMNGGILQMVLRGAYKQSYLYFLLNALRKKSQLSTYAVKLSSAHSLQWSCCLSFGPEMAEDISVKVETLNLEVEP
jgi:hypothetical protein